MIAYCPHCNTTLADDTGSTCKFCGGEGLPNGGWPKDALLGTLIDGGKYKVESRLGSGGFGHVYEVSHTLVDNRVFAMKTLNRFASGDPAHEEQFLSEIKILMSFDHPNIVKCHEVGWLEDGTLFLLMEKVEGHDLKEALKASGPLKPSRVAEIGIKIASALAAAHTRGVLHRDLKPQNVLVLEDGDLRVIDFGIAKVLGPDTEGKQLSQVIGTPSYMAPEQFFKGGAIDQRLDIYQLGAILFFLLTGKAPYDPPDDSDGLVALVEIVSQQKLRDETCGPLPSELVPSLAEEVPGLDALVGRLLATAREHRPESAGEVEELLQTWLSSGEVPESISTLHASMKARGASGAPPPPKEGNPMVFFGALMVAALLIMGAVMWLGDGDGSQTTSTSSAGAGASDGGAAATPSQPADAGAGATRGDGGQPDGAAPASAGGGKTPVAAVADAGGDASAQKPPGGGGGDTGATASLTATRGVATFKEMIRIKPGTFRMGSPEDEAMRKTDELPRELRIERPFEILKTEVTQRFWLEVMGTTPAFFKTCGLSCPVELVSWYDVLAFTNKLSQKEGLEPCYTLSRCEGIAGSGCEEGKGGCKGDYICEEVAFKGLDCKGYRLPTEAEWEYAARAGEVGPTQGELEEIAWFGVNSKREPHKVSYLKANAWGIHDMLGNIYEWCWDGYGEYPRTDKDAYNENNLSDKRVIRGCSWKNMGPLCRLAKRHREPPQNRGYHVGFRIVRTLSP